MNRQAMSALEMPEMPRQDSSVGLLGEEDTAGSNKSLAGPNLKIRDFIRQFRLQLLGHIASHFSGFVSSKEQPKVAIYRSRRVAAIHSLLHLAPLTGALTLLLLHWTKHWLGYTSGDSHFLQFIAKVHELVMQASIVEVILFVVRVGLVQGYVPLGALSGALQATQVSYLWSLDYLSVITSPALRGWRKVVFVVGIPALVALTALVGPSSAVLMIPRAGSPLVVGRGLVYVNGSSRSLYPTLASKSKGLDLSLHAFNLTRATQRVSEATYLYDKDRNMTKAAYSANYVDSRGNYQRNLRASVLAYADNLDDSGYYRLFKVNMTLPTRLSADEILFQAWNSTEDKLSTDSNRTVNVLSPHPVTSASCWEIPSNETLADTMVTYIQDDGSTSSNLQELGKFAEQVSGNGTLFNSTYGSYMIWSYPPIWMASPQAGSQSLIGIMFTMDWYGSMDKAGTVSLPQALDQKHADADVDVTVCTLSASWHMGEIQWVETAGVTLIQTSSLLASNPDDRSPIVFNLSDLGVMKSANFTREFVRISIPALYLAGSMAVALAEIPQTSWYDGVSTNHTLFTGIDPLDMTTVEYTNTLYGYGYGVRTTSSYLSLTVMSVYCVITVLYLIYSFFTGLTSTAWSSAVELVALALQSSKPSILGDSSVGIDSVRTFSQSVGVRVNTDNELELVFANDRDSSVRTLRKIERNREY